MRVQNKTAGRILSVLFLVLGLAALVTAQSATSPPASTAPVPAQPQQEQPITTPPAANPPAPAPATGSSAVASQPAVAAKPAGSAAGGDEPVATIRVRSNEVNVVFTVTDRHGRRITNLKESDFKVVDDSKPAAEINSFHAETNLPLQVGLLIDASNSVRDRFKFEQESAIEFLNQIVRRRYDLAFVVGFDVLPEVTQDFTDNTELLAHGVRELRPGGGTALYDAIYGVCRDKLLKAPNATPVRRAIILLTDGDDNQSHVTREEAIEMAQRAETVVYAISTNVSGTKGPGDKILERIADATGGRAYFPFQIRDVVNAFAEIQDELRSQYLVSYRPADLRADGRYRTIEIIPNDRKNLRVRSRRGWFAPTQ